ncbi:UNVERIFIED_ORG: putative small metal-binding protein [Burkholderia sp. 1263]
MKTIYELHPEYREAFDNLKAMNERIAELNRLECEQRIAIAEWQPTRWAEGTKRDRALQALAGSDLTSASPSEELVAMQAAHAKTKHDMDVLGAGLPSQIDLVNLLRPRISVARAKDEDFRRVAEKAEKATRALLAANEEMRSLCAEANAAGFAFSESDDLRAALLLHVDLASPEDSLDQFAKRICYVTGIGK